MDPGSPQRQAGSAMHGLPGFVHGRFPALLHAAMAAVEADRHPAVWRYNLVTAARSQPSAAV
jgi:hypothetical protein